MDKSLTIAVDGSPLSGNAAGIGYLTRGLIEGLAKQVKLIAFTREDLGAVLPQGVEQIVIPPVAKLRGGGIMWYWKLRGLAKQHKVDYILNTTLSSLPFVHRKVVTVINDLIPLSHPQLFDRKFVTRYKLMLKLTMRFSYKILAISEQTKKEITKNFPRGEEVEVINLGLNAWVAKEVSEKKMQEVKEKYKLPEKFWLSIGTLQPRKNYVRLVRAFARLHESHPELHYVIGGGKGWMFDEIFNLIKEFKLEDAVHLIGYVSDEDVGAFHALAQAELYVPLEEGFGLPVIEAQALGLPLLTSNIPVIKEVIELESVLVADPLSEDSIFHQMENLVEMQRQGRNQEIMQKYSWENTAEQIISSLGS